MALASARAGSDRRAIAVIGDGAMTAGLAFEALNHAGEVDEDLLVILNDNAMSISENVGGSRVTSPAFSPAGSTPPCARGASGS